MPRRKVLQGGRFSCGIAPGWGNSVIKMLTVVGHGTRREVQESRKHQQREVGADDQSEEAIGEKGDDVAAENLQNTSHVQPRNG
ncbi:hypothetical protein IFM89_006490 [Coptis chinensis]|uniref:Uncharacterized protein n=1 Tax=Coptis chinensis TaxID=261450 RepID=A0A835IPG3_9MAGN|nr:hypothetical protein IFM89_006490 [Coptis chinensis]